jgi:hypothetical protein
VRSSIAACATLLVALCLGACGGGDDDSDRSSAPMSSGPTVLGEAEAAAERAIENTDAESLCRGQVTKAYLQRVYGGDLKKCLGSEGSVPLEPGEATASDADVDPDERHAEVMVSVAGGSLDGTAGGVEMVKEGDGWKVDDFDDDFFRSAFLTAIEVADEGALSAPGMKACFTRQVKTMPAAVRHLSYLSNAGETEVEDAALTKLAAHCPESALAEYGAHTLTDEVGEGGNHKPGYEKCLYGEIKAQLELTGITLELFGEHPDGVAVAALDGIVEGSKRNCGG